MINDYRTVSLMEERNDLIQEFRDVSLKVLRSKGETKRFWQDERRKINKRVTEITNELGDSKNRDFDKL